MRLARLFLLPVILFGLVMGSLACTAAPISAPTPLAPTAIAPTSAPTARPATSAPVAAVPTVAPTAPATASAALAVQWFGQSTFLLTTSKGTKVLMDPTNAASGYAIAPISGVDLVTVSHEHADHNNVALALGSPTILRGLKSNDWATVNESVKDVKIQSVPTFHDPQQGAQRGKNSVFVLEVDGLRIAHLGDLGHTLSQEQKTAIGSADLVMIPIGGGFTVDAAGATEVLTQLNPRMAIPMHFRTPKVSAQSPLVTADAFLDGKKVEKLAGNRLEVSKAKLPAVNTIYLLGYEP